jgi:two-component system, cell cycle sensor histidine kinase and response regulator CckA
MFQRLDYKFDLAADGQEAVAMYRRYLDVGRPYDAVLLDQDVVGGMGGAEALSQLRGSDPEVRAIAISADSNEGFGDSCYKLGFCGWLTKPYRLAELAEVLRDVLG